MIKQHKTKLLLLLLIISFLFNIFFCIVINSKDEVINENKKQTTITQEIIAEQTDVIEQHETKIEALKQEVQVCEQEKEELKKN